MDSKRSIGYVFEGNSFAVFIVHGLGGNSSKEYWGRLIDLLNYDHRLSCYDLYYLSYRSSKKLELPALWKISSHERLSSVEELAAALADEVSRICDRCGYQAVSFLGHSLGGLLSLEAAHIAVFKKSLPVVTVGLNATPLRPPFRCRAIYWLLMPLNPQVAYVTSLPAITETLERCLPSLAAAGVYTVYMQCVGDELVRRYQKQPFSVRLTMQGAHSWMRSIRNRDDSSYDQLLRFILRTGGPG